MDSAAPDPPLFPAQLLDTPAASEPPPLSHPLSSQPRPSSPSPGRVASSVPSSFHFTPSDIHAVMTEVGGGGGDSPMPDVAQSHFGPDVDAALDYPLATSSSSLQRAQPDDESGSSHANSVDTDMGEAQSVHPLSAYYGSPVAQASQQQHHHHPHHHHNHQLQHQIQQQLQHQHQHQQLLQNPPPPDAPRRTHPPAETRHVSAPAPAVDQDRHPWYPMFEDTSTAAEDELKRLQSAGEVSALDHARWQTKAFRDLGDSEFTPLATGRIDFTINKFNGSAENPSRDLILKSEPLLMAGHTWRIKVYPKGNGTSYLAAYVECEPFSQSTSEPDQLSTALPLLGGSTLPKPKQVPAQIMLIMYNPQEPRVHFHKRSTHSFSPADPDRGFVRFGPTSCYDLGRRLPDTRQAMLRNDTLGFIAHIRVYNDCTGFLFTKDDHSVTKDFLRTGLWPVRNLTDSRGDASNLTAAVVTFTLLPQVRKILYKVGSVGASHKPLTAALQEFLVRIRSTPNVDPSSTSSAHSVELSKVGEALHWHGSNSSVRGCGAVNCGAAQNSAMDMPLKPWHPRNRTLRDFDVFQIWEFLLVTLGKELSETGLSRELGQLFTPEGCRYKMPQGSKNIRQTLTDKSGEQNLRHYPALIQVELPRLRFDESARSWKKLDERIQLSENLRLTADGMGWYSLYGLILHQGGIHSRDYTPLVRPDGNKWFKFSTTAPQRVTRLTKKQALIDSETSAYIAIYMRNDLAAKELVATSPIFEGFPEQRWASEEPPHDGQMAPACSYDGSITDAFIATLQDKATAGSEGTDYRLPASGADKRSNDCCTCDKTEDDVDLEATVSEEVHELDYFGSGYYRGTLHRGFIHGHGLRIYMNGDVYEGEFRHGARHGAGKQIFPNGDTYDGQWKDDEMDGRGIHVTKATGNTYAGGYKNGKPHGDFQITGKRAETLDGCLICYEADRNAVFYPCGHLCSCMECARKLEQCPYCQRSISDAIRLFTI